MEISRTETGCPRLWLAEICFRRKVLSVKKEKKKTWIWLGILAAVVLIVLGIWYGSQGNSQPAEGSKSYTVEVIHKDGTTKEIQETTDEDYLGQDLETKGIISGDDSQYGLYVTTVDGETADYDKDQSWWKISVNGKDAEVGVDSIPVQDGDVYTWTYVAD